MKIGIILAYTLIFDQTIGSLITGIIELEDCLISFERCLEITK
jgi:hypothetical protein